MDIAKRNSDIAAHLQKRFKERHGIELTRNRRLMLMSQIQSGVGLFLSQTSNGKKLYRVLLYNNQKGANDKFTVMYCPKDKLILTVLPKQTSDEYKDFCEGNGLSMEVVKGRELTARERTNESMKAAIKLKSETASVKRVQVSKNRLAEYNSVKKYLNRV
jgi:hypothetical protein